MTTWTPLPSGRYSPDYAPQMSESLSDILHDDNPPVRINRDGTVETVDSLYSPDAFAASDFDEDIVSAARGMGWELVTGYSQRWGYAGPVMSVDESVNMSMAHAVSITPGIYVVASIDDVNPDGYPVGWVLMRKAQ